jgi:hypothetical protein
MCDGKQKSRIRCCKSRERFKKSHAIFHEHSHTLKLIRDLLSQYWSLASWSAWRLLYRVGRLWRSIGGLLKRVNNGISACSGSL